MQTIAWWTGARRMMVLAVLVAAGLAQSGPRLGGETSPWRGGLRSFVPIDGRRVRVDAPPVRAAGNPWVWRAGPADEHPEVDDALLAQGYHVVWLDTDGMFASDRALALGDRAYAFLRERGLASRVALQGVGRGGLFVYRWAARHPERVACIHGVAPVCDIRSWPLGRGAGLGDGAAWQALRVEHGFDREQALAWTGNPVDLAAPLATARIAMLTVVGEDDRVVPPGENTYVLRQRLRASGGNLRVLSVPRGPAGSDGQLVAMPTDIVREAVSFVLRHTNDTPGGAVFHTLRDGLDRCRARLAAGGRRRVAFLGGSITHNPGWRDLVAADLRRRFPAADIDFVNAGIPSMGSTPGAFRLQRDVLDRGPVDLLFVEAAVNDRTNGRSDDEQRRAMEGIVRHALRADPGMDVVLLHFAEPDTLRTIRSGEVPAVIANHERVAQRYGLPSLDLAQEVAARIEAGEFTWRDDFVDLHPSPFGQLLYHRGIRRLLDAAWAGPPPEVAPPPRALGAPLDAACYERGVLVSIDAARPGDGFTKVAHWRPEDGAGTRAGFVDVPMLVADRPGAVLTLPFVGTAVGVFVAAGPDAGAVEWQVDGGPFVRLDLFTRWSAGLHLPWAHVLAAGLPAGEHVLTARVAAPAADAPQRRAVRIAHFLVSGSD